MSSPIALLLSVSMALAMYGLNAYGAELRRNQQGHLLTFGNFEEEKIEDEDSSLRDSGGFLHRKRLLLSLSLLLHIWPVFFESLKKHSSQSANQPATIVAQPHAGNRLIKLFQQPKLAAIWQGSSPLSRVFSRTIEAP